MRCIAYVLNGKAKLLSKSGRDISETFPDLTSDMSKLETGVYDGEIVLYDESGRVSFKRLLLTVNLINSGLNYCPPSPAKPMDATQSTRVKLADKSNQGTSYCYNLLYLKDTLLAGLTRYRESA